MSNNERTKTETWAKKLASDSVEDQIEALRQISGEETVTGLTTPIVAMAGSSDDEIRMWSAQALESSVQPEPSEVLPLMKLLQTAADGEICYWAATMLGRLGTDAAIAAGALEACLRESMYLPARERATWALSAIGPRAAIAVAALTEAAESAPPRLQRLATEVLRAIGADSSGSDNAEEAAA